MVSMLDKLSKRANAAQTTADREIHVPLEKIRFDPTQPRKAYHTLDGRVAEKDQEYIAELAATIKEHGLIQAIVVEELPDGTYLVRVGECRTRAHLLLNEKTIRAVVNNDLKSRTARLLYQVVENITRNALTDFEIAGVVKELMDGGEGEPPMNQSQVAAKLGKSEGWVVRFVAFGDDELQRRWVQTGIADTAEKLYRLKLLPPPMQLDIQRRVDLPAGHVEFLEKPIKRAVIDDYGLRAKMDKQRHRGAKVTDGEPVQGAATSGGVVPDLNHSANPATGTPASDDVIGLAMAEAAVQGRESTVPATPSAFSGKADSSDFKLAPVVGGSAYALPDNVRQQLLSGAAASNAASDEAKQKTKTVDLPPVMCRVTVNNLAALLPLLRTSPELLNAMGSVRCEVSLPGELAQSVASALVGRVVDQQELSATVQNELSKLG